MPRRNFDPIDVIQTLPWRNLLMAGGLAVAIAVVCDWLLGFGAMLLVQVSTNVPILTRLIMGFAGSEVNRFLFSLLVSGLIGVLALFYLKNSFPPSNTSLLPRSGGRSAALCWPSLSYG
jgi:hypothetical protein